MPNSKARNLTIGILFSVGIVILACGVIETPQCDGQRASLPPIITSANAREVRLLYSRTRYDDDPIFNQALSPDLSVMAEGQKDGTIVLLDAYTGDKLAVLSGHSREVFGVAFSLDGAELYSTSLDGTTRVWGVCTSAATVSSKSAATVSGTVFRSDTAETVADATVALYDIAALSESQNSQKALDTTRTGFWGAFSLTADPGKYYLVVSWEFRDLLNSPCTGSGYTRGGWPVVLGTQDDGDFILIVTAEVTVDLKDGLEPKNIDLSCS